MVRKKIKSKKKDIDQIYFNICIIAMIFITAIYFIFFGWSSHIVTEDFDSPKSAAVLIEKGVLNFENARKAAENTDLVIINQYDSIYIPAMRVINPNIKIFIYKYSGISLGSPENSCASYEFIDINHPDWFLHDMNNLRVTMKFSDWTRENSYVGNYYNQNFVDHSVANCLGSIRGLDIEGVFLDWLPVSMEWYFPDDLAEIDERQLKLGIMNYVERMHSELNQNEYLFIANFAGLQQAGLFEKFIDLTDGYVEEFFVNEYPDNRFLDNSLVLKQIKDMRTGGISIMQTRTPDEQVFDYAYSLFLMNYDSDSYFSALGDFNDWKSFEKYLEYRKKYSQIGQPVGEYKLKSKFIRREFENAGVWANMLTKQSGIDFKD